MTALATSDDLDAFGYSIPEASRDGLLNRASTIVVSRTGLKFAAGAQTVDLALSDRPLRLPQQPVTAVNSVTVTAYPVSGVTPNSEFVPTPTSWSGWVLKNGAIHGLPPVGPWSYRLYATVDYDYGYDEIPDDVKEAVCRIAQALYDNPRGLRSRQVDDYSESYDQDAASSVIDDVIDELRRAYVGDDEPAVPLR